MVIRYIKQVLFLLLGCSTIGTGCCVAPFSGNNTNDQKKIIPFDTGKIPY
jgi:hypothetical protein